jgi:exonuclease 3'-5' domain-containing protein 1
MALQTATPAMQMIDSIGALEKLLNELDHLLHRPAALFLDVQTINPEQDGSISVISLFVRPIKKVFLIDVLTLGEDVFTTTSLADNTLKLLLESPAVPKILFDVGNASAALFNHYGIRLNGIKDLQIMQLATQYPRAQQAEAASLETCVEEDAQPPARALALWTQVQSTVSQLRDPTKGGSDAVFKERPLRQAILDYHLQNVLILPWLWVLYCDTLCKPNNAFWRSMVFYTVRDRIRESMNPDSAHRADGSRWGWSREFIETSKAGWNEDILLELQGIPMVDRCWLDPTFF